MVKMLIESTSFYSHVSHIHWSWKKYNVQKPVITKDVKVKII